MLHFFKNPIPRLWNFKADEPQATLKNKSEQSSINFKAKQMSDVTPLKLISRNTARVLFIDVHVHW